MNISVSIAGNIKTSLISWPSLVIEDNINDLANICKFTIKKHSGQTYKPSVGDEVIIQDGSDKIFAGKIIRIEEMIDAGVEYIKVTCKDYTLDLDRIIVTERYENQTVAQIISDIVTNYLSGMSITTNNVNCGIEVETIAFNSLSVSKCIQLLAEQVNYSWYIDYDKDIHFFAKNTEAAPFELTDDNGKFIYNSLKIEQDISQLRNVVIIRGGDKVATNQRTKKHTGDGSKITFNTDYKFASKPTVKVNGVAKNVGTEFLEQDTGYDCMWSYDQKYVRFITAPASGDSIEIIGYPLIPIMVQVEDPISISNYGRYEFKKENKDIKSSEEARQYAQAQIEAYGASIREGMFRTYESGLKSGQVITINSSKRNINEKFIIQRVSLRLRSQADGEWLVELATLRTMGIIKFLQDLLLDKARQIEVNENEVLEKYYMDNQTVEVQEEISLHTEMQDHQTINVAEQIRKDPWTPVWVLAPYTPTGDSDNKRAGRLNISKYLY